MNYSKIHIVIVLLLFTNSGFSQMIIAHRGSSSLAPENTLASVELAIAQNAMAVEIDVRLSKDDSIMVIHDENLERTTNGTGEVKDHNYQELKQLNAGYEKKFGKDFISENIPTLYEIIQITKGKTTLCIDLKNVPENKVIEIIYHHSIENDVYLMSYNFDKLKRIRSGYPDLNLILISNTLNNSIIEKAYNQQINGISSSYLSSLKLCKEVQKKGLLCWIGIIDNPEKLNTKAFSEADGIITNNPDFFKEQLYISQVSPNPCHDEITIRIRKDIDSIISIQFFDLKGKLTFEHYEFFDNINFFSLPKELYQKKFIVRINWKNRVESHLILSE